MSGRARGKGACSASSIALTSHLHRASPDRMTFRTTPIVSALLLVLASTLAFVSGCGSTTKGTSGSAVCESNCAAGNACAGAVQHDCATACADAATLMDASGCAATFDAAMSCEAGLSDVCGSFASCQAKLDDVGSCVQPYCAANPGATGCDLF